MFLFMSALCITQCLRCHNSRGNPGDETWPRASCWVYESHVVHWLPRNVRLCISVQLHFKIAPDPPGFIILPLKLFRAFTSFIFSSKKFKVLIC